MTFGAPLWLALGAAAAIALVGLHLLAIGRPAPWLLPTARFIPIRAARARRLATRPTDRLLLATRVAAVLLAAIALSHPTRTPARRPVARVIVADLSSATRDAREVRDSVHALAAVGDVVIAFDSAPSAAVNVSDVTRDSLLDARTAANSSRGARVVPGVLSAALASARREAPALRERADSLELVIVSPLTARELDAATHAVRGAWGGRARVVRVAATPTDSTVATVAVRGGPADDVLAAVLPATANARTTRRIVRGGASAADSAMARDSGIVLVDWPANGAPAAWPRRTHADVAGGVTALDGSHATFIAPLSRTVTLPSPMPNDALVIARWADGEPAAIEHPLGRGCVREVAVAVPQNGDAALRTPFRAFVTAMTSPCATASMGAPIDARAVASLAGTGALLATRSLATPHAPRDPIARWLLAAALALLLLELPLRSVGRRTADDANADVDASDAAPSREAA